LFEAACGKHGQGCQNKCSLDEVCRSSQMFHLLGQGFLWLAGISYRPTAVVWQYEH
jgi:hypothetical protein